MATLPTQSFSAIVSNIAAGMQGRISSFLNFAVGSILLAIAEAYAGVILWLQGMILSVAMLTRLSTSYGDDADSWAADFGIIERIGAVAATGLVVFSRYTPSGAAPIIPIGAQVKTTDGTQVFQVYADTTNPAYSPSAGGTQSAPIAGYIMPAQVASLIVPVVNITPNPANGQNAPGSNGNVAAGTISIIATAIAGVDSVANTAAFTNGSDRETDPAFKARFRLAIASLSRGTPVALKFCIVSLQTNFQVQVLPSITYGGVSTPGFVTVIVDDGSGQISSALVTEAGNAVNAYIAAGIRFGVYPAVRDNVKVQFTPTIAPGYYAPNVIAVASATIAANINALGLGNGIGYFNVGAWALAIPGITQIDNLTVNGSTADIAGDPHKTSKCTGVVVN
jgi:uncharacterized phage protein gp47/JayE